MATRFRRIVQTLVGVAFLAILMPTQPAAASVGTEARSDDTYSIMATGSCGSGYGLLKSYAITHKDYGTVGHIKTYWSSTAKRNCVVVQATGAAYGWRGAKYAGIRPSGTYDWAYDHNDYYYYAGPVYTPSNVNMSGKCIDVYGLIAVPNGSPAAYRRIDGIHCG